MPRSCSFHQTSAALRTKWQRDPDTRNVTVIWALLRVSTNQPPRASAVGELADFPQTSWSQQAEQKFLQENPSIHMFFCNLLPLGWTCCPGGHFVFIKGSASKCFVSAMPSEGSSSSERKALNFGNLGKAVDSVDSKFGHTKCEHWGMMLLQDWTPFNKI